MQPLAVVSLLALLLAFLLRALPLHSHTHVRCDQQPQVVSLQSGEDRSVLDAALQAFEEAGVPFIVRNASTRRLTSQMLASRCPAAANDMVRQTQGFLDRIAELDSRLLRLLNAFLGLRCWWTGGGPCSVDEVGSRYPATLYEYQRTTVVPFGAFCGDRVLHWAMGEVAFALLLDWSFMVSGFHGTSTVYEGDDGCTAAGMLGAETTLDALAEDLGGPLIRAQAESGEMRSVSDGSLDLFVAATAQHHNLLHRHRDFCAGVARVRPLAGLWWDCGRRLTVAVRRGQPSSALRVPLSQVWCPSHGSLRAERPGGFTLQRSRRNLGHPAVNRAAATRGHRA